jgi:hypothetical protein
MKVRRAHGSFALWVFGAIGVASLLGCGREEETAGPTLASGGSGGAIDAGTSADGAAGNGGAGASPDASGGTGGTNFDGAAGSGGAGGTNFDAAAGSSGTGGAVDDGAAGSGGAGDDGAAGSGGAGRDGAAGSGGAGGTVVTARSDKIDLLFTIDNSSSMADKQQIVAQLGPDLVSRLMSPACIDSQTHLWVSDSGPCPSGSEPEMAPVKDIHIGIISSSLGGHGAALCLPTEANKQGADMAHLLSRGLPAAPAGGFLAWDGGTSMTREALTATFEMLMTGVGENGCGYEAQLESVYRFLVDPEPYATIALDASSNAVPTDIDQTILVQRADFLRPDSLVVVIAVSDEDDCSLNDGGQNWTVLEPPRSGMSLLKGGTQQCAQNPNDACCQSCSQPQRSGCPDISVDPNCLAGFLTAATDPQNLRCFDQKRKYGYDFLYPVARYIDAAKGKDVPNRAGTLVRNPLFSDLSVACKNGQVCAPPRDPTLVFWAGIVGVPWQDIARDPADLTRGLKTGRELLDTGVWPIIVGDPSASPPVPPTDPLMIQSVAPRSAITTGNPLGSAALPQSPASGPRANPINGHEWEPQFDTPPNADLQYACVFSLPASRQCTPANTACDCNGTPGTRFNPLCQDETTGAYSTWQARAKGYPGTRQLRVIQGLGDQGIAASICPKTLDPAKTNDRDYGYRPTVQTLIEGFKRALR